MSDESAIVDYEARLVDLIRSNDAVMESLRSVRALGVEHWCIAAGAIRNLVWDDLHGHAEPTSASDIDVLIYDAERTDSAYERELEHRLSATVSDVRWEVVNQATIHSYTGDPEPYVSIEDAMSRWADLVTAVGAHLDDTDNVSIISPGGLDDLFELRVRPNLATPTSAEVYRQRTTTKGWAERWPQLTIEELPRNR